MSDRKPQIVSVAIYPGIGVARLGDSPEGWFMGPEAPGEVPGGEPGFRFKDDEGRIKRQAARFRIYGLDAEGRAVREIHLGQKGTEIEWTVHVANKKAAWYVFNNAMDLPGSIAMDAVRRNKKVLGDDRRRLTIDPGTRSIAGANQQGVTLEGDFQVDQYRRRVTLGELRTDERGRLVFLGGFGRSDSAPPSNPITNFSNNDGWHDDVCDGPVTATVTLPDGRRLEAEPAWAVSTPPNYAPGITPIITLWDLIRETTDAPGLAEAMARPDFARDIYPILERYSMMQWVSTAQVLLVGWQAELDFLDPEYLALLADNDPGHPKSAAARKRLFRRFREPDAEVFEPAALPVMLGDGVDYPDDPRSLLALLPSQYEMLRQWSRGNFTDKGWRKAIHLPPRPLDDYPIAERPAALDRGALEPLLGGAFHPGIEVTWPMRQPRLYQAPFRLRPYDPSEPAREDFGPLLTPDACLAADGPLARNTPGDLTRWMGVPWQSDAASCQDVYVPQDFPLPVWWPAILPVDVMPEVAYRQVMDRKLPTAQRWKFFGFRRDWPRGVGDVGYHAEGGYSQAMIHMVNDWSLLGFVVARPGPKDAAKAGLPGDLYVETERGELEA
jgi:hypothetical protein